MTDPSTAERLAALQARRKPRHGPVTVAPDQTRVLTGSDLNNPPMIVPGSAAGAQSPLESSPPGPAVEPQLLQTTVLSAGPELTASYAPPESSGLRLEMSWSRVAAAGASAVSFASMIVAMGPLFKTAEPVAAAGQPVEASLTAGVEGGIPTAPPVAIDTQTGQSQPSQGGAVTDGSVGPVVVAGSVPPADQTPPAPATQPTTQPAATSPPSTQPPVSQPPASQSAESQPAASQPAESQPASDQPPASQPAQTAPPQTALPSTAPPQTAPPTTAPPQTAPPETAPPTSNTAPPRSDGSGG